MDYRKISKTTCKQCVCKNKEISAMREALLWFSDYRNYEDTIGHNHLPVWAEGITRAKRALEGPWIAEYVFEDDAFLIAAAPALYEALETLAAEEHRDDDDPILQAARVKAHVALAKARGETCT